MSQRESGYERIERDCYETPEWVTRAVATSRQHQVRVGACGWIGKNGASARGGWPASPLDRHFSWTGFLASRQTIRRRHRDQPALYLRNTVYRTCSAPDEWCGKVAMLLRTDFDHAKRRRHLFSDCPAFARKIVLTKRIRWFENSSGQPSFNHAWYIWDHKHTGKPTLEYDLQH